ncbi:hypothetical protein ACFUTX_13690 [Microbacterium sp. NPDC057407]|uniref:hypothetical protein n=1 Tax=Microbacterium sp. NPDC057407 TaxID=3346120 RepID=UPI0036734810
MSDPNDTTPPPSDGGAPATDTATPAPTSSPDAQPTEAYPPAPSGDAQPTVPYPPAYEQPTTAFPAADGQPTAAYPPSDAPPAAPYGQAYGQPAYDAPVSTADRPRTLGWASLGLAIGGLVLVGAAFIPLAWGSLVLALVGGLLLLVALVLGIVTLVSKKQGGKGLGIGAIAVSVFGGILWVGALTAAFLWIGLSMAGSASGSESDSDVTVTEEAPAGTYDEAAYLDAVRPEILAIMQEIEPSVSEELVAEFYTDDMLIATGKGLVLAGEAGREAFISSTVESSQGTFDENQATRFYDVVHDAAEQYLSE